MLSIRELCMPSQWGCALTPANERKYLYLFLVSWKKSVATQTSVPQVLSWKNPVDKRQKLWFFFFFFFLLCTQDHFNIRRLFKGKQFSTSVSNGLVVSWSVPKYGEHWAYQVLFCDAAAQPVAPSRLAADTSFLCISGWAPRACCCWQLTSSFSAFFFRLFLRSVVNVLTTRENRAASRFLISYKYV